MANGQLGTGAPRAYGCYPDRSEFGSAVWPVLPEPADAARDQTSSVLSQIMYAVSANRDPAQPSQVGPGLVLDAQGR
jgi:hypothetical protein